ncbi:serine protein kinase RIO [Allokutzneria albata]|uniref:non-specific serine/threonine protein kinase n=1 Tax=Allokutzneria albata TaxID=211114 RepID=A0A1G9X9K0_ALLAB|nr:RIO kinase 1 [Allokutzneria albata]
MRPHVLPGWLITDDCAVDHDLGVLKTGKEADVHLIERTVPGSGASCLLAAKRYRGAEHRMFHRDAGYLEGRKTNKSRDTRAIANRTRYGRDVISQQWAQAEFTALTRLWAAGVPVPCPVAYLGTELLLEFVGEPDGSAAPRLAQLRPDRDELRDLWFQLVEAMLLMAAEGVTHGDLSPFNLLVHGDRLVVIDLPQVVDLVSNPQSELFLRRDVRTTCAWFVARGLPEDVADAEWLEELLRREAGLM